MRYLIITLIVLGVIFTHPGLLDAQEVLTLTEAKSLAFKHNMVVTWQNEIQSTERSLEQLLAGEEWSLTVGDSRVIRYTYPLEDGEPSWSIAPQASLSKSNLKGFSLTANLTPQYNSQSEWDVTWSVRASQQIFPTPDLSSTNVNLRVLEQELSVQQAQQDVLYHLVELEIEELYRQAQFSAAQAELAALSYKLEEGEHQKVLQRKRLGEAGELDLINSELALLNAQQELDGANRRKQQAYTTLAQAIELGSIDFELEPLVGSDFVVSDYRLAKAELVELAKSQNMGIAQALADVKRRELELAQAQDGLRPDVNLNVEIADSDRSGSPKNLVAYVGLEYPLLDGNQRRQTVLDKEEALEDAIKAYHEEQEDLRQQVNDRLDEVKSREKDLEIARLSLRKAELELEVLKQQHDQGLIDEARIIRQQATLEQATLNYWETLLEYDFLVRRLSQGIIEESVAVGRQQ